MKMKVVGTGLSGLVGSRLTQLYSKEFDFINLDLSTGVDILDFSSVKKAIEESRAEILIHLAAYTNVAEAHNQDGDKTGLCYRVNVEGTTNVAQCCKELGIYLIHVSTDYVFDGTKASLYIESDSPNPVDWYGKTKYWAEREVEKLKGDYAILRLAFPYLAEPVRPDLLMKLIDQMKSGTLPPQFGDNLITPTLVDDFCLAINKVLIDRPQEIYHATGSSSHSSYEIAVMIRDKMGIESEIVKGSLEKYMSESGRALPVKLRISNEKLKRDLGIEMKTFEEGLDEVMSQIARL